MCTHTRVGGCALRGVGAQHVVCHYLTGGVTAALANIGGGERASPSRAVSPDQRQSSLPRPTPPNLRASPSTAARPEITSARAHVGLCVAACVYQRE